MSKRQDAKAAREADRAKSSKPTAGKIPLDSPVAGQVSSSAGNAPQGKTQGERAMATLRKRKTDKSGSTSYAIEGVRASVYLNKGIVAGTSMPDSLSIELPEGFKFAEPGEAGAKVGIAALTPEQRKEMVEKRKAEQAALTPAQRAAQKLERARAALAAAEKAAAAAEKASEAANQASA